MSPLRRLLRWLNKLFGGTPRGQRCLMAALNALNAMEGARYVR